MENKPVLAVIGGSGLYNFPALKNTQSVEIETPFGMPSSPIITGELSGRKVAFLARHGIGHVYLPSEVNYRANIYALKSLGVDRIVSISACGSLREDYSPGHIVIPTQLVDLTHKRERTFFGDGIVAHHWFRRPILRQPVKTGVRCPAGQRSHHPQKRHLCHHRRAALLHQSGIQPVPRMGYVPDRYDRLPRSHAGP